MGKYHSELLMLFNLAFLMKCKYCLLNIFGFILIVYMSMCVYKYLYNEHMIQGCWGGGGKSGADSEIYYRGAHCIGEGSGENLGSQRVQGIHPEAPGNQGFEEHLDRNDNMKHVNNKRKEKTSELFPLDRQLFPLDKRTFHPPSLSLSLSLLLGEGCS